jgi:hypothetical protein
MGGKFWAVRERNLGRPRGIFQVAREKKKKRKMEGLVAG